MSAIRSSSIALLAALMAAPAVAAQQRATGPAVEGAVYDTVSGKPIPFAVISVAGTGISTLTNRAGRFRVVVNVGEVELEFRKIGFRRQSVIMTVADDTIVPDVFLTPLPVELATIRVTARG
ncbi:MAG: carboxypeptidase-like regulatory domain-containing protein, partial [Gemmatimonadetes bacterium]|nr:carboxypeptidase-like regulatory domain-containing protein [Gemmatimonadota bacterium]